ncbi:hypothetical protein ACYQR9_15455 [Methylobacterium sp. CM6241]
MTVRRFLGAVGALVAATLAAIAAAPRLIWEGGRWVLRSLAPPAEARQAENALIEQVADLVAETEAKAEIAAATGIVKADVGPDFHRNLGRAALQHLLCEDDADPTLAAMLSDETRSYLANLPRDRLAIFVCLQAEVIGRHLSGDARLATMPRVPLYREWQQAESARLVKAKHSPDPADYRRVVRGVDVPDAADEPEEDAVRFGMR